MEAAPVMPTTQWLEGPQQLSGIIRQWDALCNRCAWSTPFQRPDWLVPWCRVWGPEQVWILTVWSGRSLVGLAPMFVDEQPGQPRTVRPLGAGMSDYLGAVAAVGWESTVWRCLLLALEERKHAWDVCDWPDLPVQAPWLDMKLPNAWCRVVTVHDVCPALYLHKAASAELGALLPPAPIRPTAAAGDESERRQLQLHAVAAAEAPERLEALFDLPSLQWTTRMGKARLSEPRVRSFQREVAERFAVKKRLVLLQLCLGTLPIAVLYGFRERGVTYLYLSGFDPRYTNLRAGEVLLRSTMLWLGGGQSLPNKSVLRGRDAYKYAWGAGDCHTARLHLWRP